MSDVSDFRSDRSESLEGYGIARKRWDAFHERIPLPLAMAAAEVRDRNTPFEDLPEEIKAKLSQEAIEKSELLGFWMAWHIAGGFRNLERGGWHRATIHRKIGRFRRRFGEHPDEFRLSWAKLDLIKAWQEELLIALDRYDQDRYEPEPDDL